MKKRYDVGIIGGGPGASTLGALLVKQGLEVAIFEREPYPRFHIGESLLPASMPIHQKTGFYETLSSGKYIEKHGARFVDYRSEGEIYFGFDDSLIPAFPMAYEVPRAEFDRDLLEHARKLGVAVYQPERVRDVQLLKDHVLIQSELREVECRFVADASGRDAFLGRKTGTRLPNQDLNNVAVFAHFEGVKRQPGKHEGDIVIALLPQNAWAWIIPFKGNVTSVGVVCPATVFKGRTDLAAYLKERLAESVEAQAYVKDARLCWSPQVVSNYSHTSASFFGDRWILIGDAAAFLDPIFSSGVHVATQSAAFAAEALTGALRSSYTLADEGLGAKYETDVRRGVKRFHSLISLFYNGKSFVDQMRKTLTLPATRRSFTSAVAGDMWNEENFLFDKGVL